jgi:hypothetical protein
MTEIAVEEAKTRAEVDYSRAARFFRGFEDGQVKGLLHNDPGCPHDDPDYKDGWRKGIASAQRTLNRWFDLC